MMTRMTKCGATFSLFLLALGGCDTAPPAPKQAPFDPAAEQKWAASLPESDQMIEAKVTPDGAKLIAGMNAFGIDLYRSLEGEKGNLFISGASVSTAFGLAHAGAVGTTAEELARVMRYPADVKDVHAAAKDVQLSLTLAVQKRVMKVSNALWVQQGMALRPEYLTRVKANYGAGLQYVDYQANPDAARGAINNWVLKETHGRIRDLVQPDDVTKETRAHLVNTAYFKARWDSEFEPEVTKDEPFFRLSGKKGKLPLMHQWMDLQYVAGDGMQAVALPYFGRETAMIIILPDRKDGLGGVEAKLSGTWLAGWLAKLDAAEGREVKLWLPKFKLEQRHDLSDPLTGLGLRTALTDAADFSGMTTNPRDALKLGKIVQQTFVEVEEKGTEAAAATYAEAAAGAAPGAPPKPVTFRADHPFLFLIRDQRTGLILFMGRFAGE